MPSALPVSYRKTDMAQNMREGAGVPKAKTSAAEGLIRHAQNNPRDDGLLAHGQISHTPRGRSSSPSLANRFAYGCAWVVQAPSDGVCFVALLT
jgi:hypothetical protein